MHLVQFILVGVSSAQYLDSSLEGEATSSFRFRDFCDMLRFQTSQSGKTEAEIFGYSKVQ